MKHVAAVRKTLGIRTIFNILGPLVNPARATHQLLGAGRPELRPLLAGAMARLGTRRTLVVSGEDGLGDVTLTGITHVTEVFPLPLPPGEGRGEGALSPSPVRGGARGGELSGEGLRDFTWTPEDFGLPRQSLAGLAVDSPAASAAIIRSILDGLPGPARDVVILNAAAGLIAFGKTGDPKTAAAQAATAIDTGAAKQLLERLAQRSHAPT
jgi:anthranilate phosphoribosyltransferase